jgi:hypothetical protein
MTPWLSSLNFSRRSVDNALLAAGFTGKAFALIGHVSGAIEDLTNVAILNRVVPLTSTVKGT